MSLLRTKSIEQSIADTDERPDLKRAFTVPFSPVLPIVSAAICAYLMLNLSVETWLRFLIWLVIGFVIFFTYSRSRSRLAKRPVMVER